DAAAVPARCQAQPPVFSSDVRCDFIQFLAMRVATPHRVVVYNADAAADVLGRDCARGCLRGGRRRRSRLGRESNGCWKKQKRKQTMRMTHGTDLWQERKGHKN